jgi:spore coat polysaccharide biosynthesis protein SpsF
MFHYYRSQGKACMFVLPIIQARTNSSRLPGKILKPFSSGLNTIDYVIRAVRAAGLDRLALATTDSLNDDALANRYGKEILVFRGSESDVLSRYVELIRQHRPDYVIRICADNPLLFVDGIRYLIDQIASNPEERYLSFSVWGKPAIKTPLGIFVELVKAEALLEAARAPTSLDREHVTIGLYEAGRKGFKLFDFEKQFFPMPENLRLTMDTVVDFDNIDAILRRFPEMKVVDRAALEKIVEFVTGSGLMEGMRAESAKAINTKNYTAGRR